jgi:hypothetical protein
MAEDSEILQICEAVEIEVLYFDIWEWILEKLFLCI